MTEAEWLICKDPQKMLEFLRPQATDRKLRLFAAACVRRLGGLLSGDSCLNAVTAVERFADGFLTTEELLSVWTDVGNTKLPTKITWASHLAGMSAWGAAQPISGNNSPKDAAVAAAWNAALTASWAVARVACNLIKTPAWNAAYEAERIAQVAVLCDIFGNPLRPITVDPDWLTPGMVELARTIYDDRAFDRLPVLADALEEAGCTNGDILGHCRQQGEHVRGCWVVDLVLGKK